MLDEAGVNVTALTLEDPDEKMELAQTATCLSPDTNQLNNIAEARYANTHVCLSICLSVCLSVSGYLCTGCLCTQWLGDTVAPAVKQQFLACSC